MSLREKFDRDGYAVVEAFLDDATLEALTDRAGALAAEYELGPAPSLFSTHTHRHAADESFLESASQVRCFLEEEAFDNEGKLRQPLPESINKIGHALHELDPVYAPFSRSSRLKDIARRLGLAKPDPVQSMIIFKQPRIGGEVVWHQDATFLYTEPPSVIGFWFALEDAGAHNGCLEVLAGAHTQGLKRRFVRAGNDIHFEELAEPGWQAPVVTRLEAPAGTMVMLHGLLPHRSAPNHSARSRLAYSLHMVDANCHYAETNWLQRPAGI